MNVVPYKPATHIDDLHGFEAFVDTSGVLTIGDYQNLDTNTLEEELAEAFKTHQTYLEMCKSIPNVAHPAYTDGYKKAEKILMTIEHITCVLIKREDVEEGKKQGIEAALQNVQDIFRLIALPDGCFTRSDAELLRERIFAPPTAEFYDAPGDLGRYLSPKASVSDITRYFTCAWLTKGCWNKIGMIAPTTNRFYEIHYTRMFTVVNLLVNCQFQSPSLLSSSSSQDSSLELFPSQSERSMSGFKGFFLSLFGQSSQPDSHSESPSVANKEFRLRAFHDLQKDPGFKEFLTSNCFEEDVEFISYDKLIEDFKLSHKESQENDFILLYHKRI